MGCCISKNSDSKLHNINPDDVNSIPFQNKRIKARVTKVYDGDTITIVFMNGNSPIKTNIRVFGIDAPEITKRGDTTQLEKDAGLRVRDIVRELIYDQVIDVILLKHDKYGGRIVGQVYIDENKTLSEYLLENKLAIEYNGGTKNKFTKTQLNYILKFSS